MNLQSSIDLVAVWPIVFTKRIVFCLFIHKITNLFFLIRLSGEKKSRTKNRNCYISLQVAIRWINIFNKLLSVTIGDLIILHDNPLNFESRHVLDIRPTEEYPFWTLVNLIEQPLIERRQLLNDSLIGSFCIWTQTPYRVS